VGITITTDLKQANETHVMDRNAVVCTLGHGCLQDNIKASRTCETSK
jgi:hypothetical protein